MNTITFLSNIKSLSYKLHRHDVKLYIDVGFGYLDGTIDSVHISVGVKGSNLKGYSAWWFTSDCGSIGQVFDSAIDCVTKVIERIITVHNDET